jgi:hypothetical protein
MRDRVITPAIRKQIVALARAIARATGADPNRVCDWFNFIAESYFEAANRGLYRRPRGQTGSGGE